MNSRNKKYLIILGVILIAIILVLLSWQYSRDQRLRVVFLDVGQGDSILIRTPQGKDILIDGGSDNRVLLGLGKYLPFYDRDIELMILTHAHDDHYFGQIEVLKRYEVKQVLYSGVPSEAHDYQEWERIIKEKDIPLHQVQTHQILPLENNLDLQILYPLEDLTEKEIDDINDTSVCVRLDYQDIEFILTGDASQKVEKRLLETYIASELESEVLKAGHHGSKTASARDFIEVVNPEYAAIQCGLDNKFKHPHFITLKNLELLEINILRNDLDGDIEFRTDGKVLEQILP